MENSGQIIQSGIVYNQMMSYVCEGGMERWRQRIDMVVAVETVDQAAFYYSVLYMTGHEKWQTACHKVKTTADMSRRVNVKAFAVVELQSACIQKRVNDGVCMRCKERADRPGVSVVVETRGRLYRSGRRAVLTGTNSRKRHQRIIHSQLQMLLSVTSA